MTAPTAAERVARGAQLLDEKQPGWSDRIDLSVLNLQHSCRCVLGQVFAAVAASTFTDPYLLGRDLLWIGTDHAAALHGFNVMPEHPSGTTSAEMHDEYAELDELWIAEIKRRTGGAV